MKLLHNIRIAVMAMLLVLLPGLALAASITPLTEGGLKGQPERHSLVFADKAAGNINRSPMNSIVGFPFAKWTTIRRNGKIIETITPLGGWIECFNDSTQSTFGPDDNDVVFSTAGRPSGWAKPNNLVTLQNEGSKTILETTAQYGFQVGFQARREAFCYHSDINTGFVDTTSRGQVILNGHNVTDKFEPRILRVDNMYTLTPKPGVVCTNDGDQEGLRVRLSNWGTSLGTQGGSVRLTNDLLDIDGVTNTITINAPGLNCYGAGQGDAFRVGFGSGAFLTTAKVGIGVDGTAWQTGGTGGLPIQGNVRVAPTGEQTRWRYVVNGGLENNASGGYTPVELFGTIELLNVTDGCPQVDMQSVYKVTVYDYGQRACTPGAFAFAFKGADITPLLEPLRPVTLNRAEVAEVQLNFRAPLASPRCTTDQKRPFIGQNTWLVAFNGGCYPIGGGFDIVRPVIAINPIN